MSGRLAGKEICMTDASVGTGRAVVVGVDGSDDSLVAVDLAAAEAELRHLPLEIVHGFVPPLLTGPTAPVPPDLPAAGAEMPAAELRRHAERLLHDAAARVRASHPELSMISRLRDGLPAGVLTAASHQATLVVVGHRGRGGFPGMLAGSVGVQLAAHAASPVIVARGQARPDAPVVLGADGSEGSRRAARFALEAAARYRVPLVALYAWPPDAAWPPELVQAGYPPPEAPDMVGETMAGLADRHPQVTVRPEVHKHTAAHEALVSASGNARLVVVGSRGRGGFRGLLLGSVSQALIHHSRAPVAVVGPESHRPEEGSDAWTSATGPAE
jgi:nucleotide-binding universal stress UspA family protein